jgi:prophage maintenance system killer protein
LAIAINEAVREGDEWFDEQDDLDRITTALQSIQEMSDPVAAAARLAFRVAVTQAFTEGNKRTALLLARWVLDHNGIDGARFLPSDDEQLPVLLVKAAAGLDVEQEILDVLESRR